jgi:formyltetrahydrofolate synthetase
MLEAGLPNLLAHIHNAKLFGIPVVVAINAFTDDTDAEIELVRKASLEAGATAAAHTNHWAEGGAGAIDVAEAVVAACEEPSDFKFLYPLDISIRHKIEIIAKEIYGASDVKYDGLAERQIASFEKHGWGELPICVAKTHLSISQDPNLKGAPRGHTVRVREVRASVGAGFIYPLLGTMRTMPGLGMTPAYMNVDIDDDGKVVGLF